MSTTGKALLTLTAAAGAGSGAYGVALATPPGNAGTFTGGAAPLAVRLDRIVRDLSATAAYTKTGLIVLSLSPSTPVTIDLTALSGVLAGDTSFATWFELLFTNLGTQDVTITPGVSNPASLLLTGTTPGHTLRANGGTLPLHSPAGEAITSGAKTITLNPGSSAAVVALAIGGA